MLELYHFPFSTCSQKVRLVLAEKGLDFVSHEVDIISGRQHDPEYVKLNPGHVVPTLVHDGRPVIESKLGVFAEWCRPEAVLRADRLAQHWSDRAEATRYLYARPDLFSLHMLTVPPQLDRDDVRLAIHDEEDWEEVQDILDALGPESLDWQFITALLDRQPTIRARMAQRNRAGCAFRGEPLLASR